MSRDSTKVNGRNILKYDLRFTDEFNHDLRSLN